VSLESKLPLEFTAPWNAIDAGNSYLVNTGAACVPPPPKMLAMSEIIDGIGPSKLSPRPAASDRSDEPPEDWVCGEPLPELDGELCTLPDPPAPATTPPRVWADTRPLPATPPMVSADARLSSAVETPANSEANSLEIRSEEVDKSTPQFHPNMRDLNNWGRQHRSGGGKACTLSNLGQVKNSRYVA
jgi:hypothetical protein